MSGEEGRMYMGANTGAAGRKYDKGKLRHTKTGEEMTVTKDRRRNDCNERK